MRSLYLRVTSGVVLACVFFAVASIALGAIGIVGVQSARSAGAAVAHDELATAKITALLGQRMDSSFASGLQLALSADGSPRAELVRTLTNRQLPDVEASLVALRQIHLDDDRTEFAGITLLFKQWAVVRALLNSITPAQSATPARAEELRSRFSVVQDHVTTLINREDGDAAAGQARAAAHARRLTWVIVAAAAIVVLASIGLAFAAARKVRHALEPAEDQVEFADTLQLADDEDEANLLLQRHLERTVARSSVVVLNRNNSADRLEAANQLPEDSPLIATLTHAEPRSCLAVRSGREHDEAQSRKALLGCAVCGDCTGSSTCMPLTVGGEVIGSVLVNRLESYQQADRQRIRESVGQAAPVLANLRNLAIAELRAATDSLTGLPNKRAVGDTLKRMLAQASRTLTPMALLLIDLDHFKDINDRLGHPVGDQALANVGAALRAALRDSDFAGRNGGEEFAVLLPDTDLDGARLTAEKIREFIADVTLPGVDLEITASVGVACYPHHGTSTERLERLADSALYMAKRSGRNRVEVAADALEPNDEFSAETSPETLPLASANGHPPNGN